MKELLPKVLRTFFYTLLTLGKLKNNPSKKMPSEFQKTFVIIENLFFKPHPGLAWHPQLLQIRRCLHLSHNQHNHLHQSHI